GSPAGERERNADETQHRKRIGRTFAIATRMVTVAEYQRFRDTHREVARPAQPKFSPEPSCPVVGVTWFQAAMYCNWLSDQEKLPRTQWCFPEKNGQGMK